MEPVADNLTPFVKRMIRAQAILEKMLRGPIYVIASREGFTALCRFCGRQRPMAQDEQQEAVVGTVVYMEHDATCPLLIRDQLISGNPDVERPLG